MSVGGPRDSGWEEQARPEQVRLAGTDGAQQTAGAPEEGPGKNRKWTAALVGLVVVFAVLAAYDLISQRGVLGGKPVTTAATSAPRSAIASSGGSPSAARTVRASASATASRSPTASAPATGPGVRALSAVSAVAFGPDGTSDGDNPGIASHVLAAGGSAWQSNWYRTAAFGNLQAGTGLLLDMGQPVSVSDVRLVLGPSVGADVQVRLGDTPELGALTTAADRPGVGGTVHVRLRAAVRARYVLVWFTLLPPDSAGTYKVSVYSITVDGQS